MFVYSEAERPLRRQDLRSELLAAGWHVHFAPMTGTQALVLEGVIVRDRVLGGRTIEAAETLRARVLEGRSIPPGCTVEAAPFDAPAELIARLAESQGPNFAAALKRSKVRYSIGGTGALHRAIEQAVLKITGGVGA